MKRDLYKETADKANGVYVAFELVTEPDDCAGTPDENEEGFWPSQNHEDAGCMGECTDEEFSKAYQAAVNRMAAYEAGGWVLGTFRIRLRASLTGKRYGLTNTKSPFAKLANIFVTRRMRTLTTFSPYELNSIRLPSPICCTVFASIRTC